MRNFWLKSLSVLVLFFISSCAIFGGTSDSGVSKFISGASKVDVVKDVHIVNMIRAIGVPDTSLVIGKYKYYKWEYARTVGVSTLLGGGSTTFYCNFSAETQNNKVQLLNWYGNQCDIFLDQINDYFRNRLNIVVITDDDIKQQTVTAKKVVTIAEQKSETPEIVTPKEKEIIAPKEKNSEKTDNSSAEHLETNF